MGPDNTYSVSVKLGFDTPGSCLEAVDWVSEGGACKQWYKVVVVS